MCLVTFLDAGIVVSYYMFLAMENYQCFIFLFQSKEEVCPPDCPCDQPQNWRSQNIPLMGLEVVEIQNFKGRDHEVDFLKFLFRCAPLTTKVTMKLASKVDPRNRGCKEAFNIFKANPAVECKVYLKSGSKVTYVRASRSSQR